jgi:hypothetical protein
VSDIAGLMEAAKDGDVWCEYDDHDGCWYVQSDTDCETIPFLLRGTFQRDEAFRLLDSLEALHVNFAGRDLPGDVWEGMVQIVLADFRTLKAKPEGK